jgi:hypothetical protein
LRFALCDRVTTIVDREVDCVAFTHHHFANIRDIARGADSERAAVAVAAARRARDVALCDQLCKTS